MSERRYPNPWVVVPALIGGGLAGAITYALVQCDGFCWRGVAWAVVVGLAALTGFGTVAVLADRSIREWRLAVDQGVAPPEPGCESDSDRAEPTSDSEPHGDLE